MSRRRIATLTAAATLALTGVFGASAQAAHHENLIREVHETGADGDYVVLQAYSAGQNIFGGASQVVTYDGGGNPLSNVVIPTVANGSNQATVLVGDVGVPGADATNATFNVVNTGGTVCFAEGTTIIADPTALDCVAYTNGATMFPPVPPASPYGTPLSIGANINGQSLVRNITRGCVTALDLADDTNNSATDFAIGPTAPRNNATAPTELLCAPCKNQTATMVGTEGPDTLTGTAGKDVVSALGGNDTVNGLNGKDVICGGDGKDKLNGGNAKDTLLGGAGKDSLNGGNGKDKLLGQGGKDVCKGGKGDDAAKKCEKEKGI
jgi:Ca2+-binding RTX toxin-like protein